MTAEGALLACGERDVDVGLSVGDDAVGVQDLGSAFLIDEDVLVLRRVFHVVVGAFLRGADGRQYGAVLDVVLLDGLVDRLQNQVTALEAKAVDFLNLRAPVDLGWSRGQTGLREAGIGNGRTQGDKQRSRRPAPASSRDPLIS